MTNNCYVVLLCDSAKFLSIVEKRIVYVFLEKSCAEECARRCNEWLFKYGWHQDSDERPWDYWINKPVNVLDPDWKSGKSIYKVEEFPLKFHLDQLLEELGQ